MPTGPVKFISRVPHGLMSPNDHTFSSIVKEASRPPVRSQNARSSLKKSDLRSFVQGPRVRVSVDSYARKSRDVG
jgi:hypothetical protein